MQDPSDPADIVRLNIVSRDGSRHQINGKVGDNLMYLAHRYQDENPHILLEGACEGSVACATCHVVVDETHFDDLPEPSEDEEDMLDTAPGLQPTRREQRAANEAAHVDLGGREDRYCIEVADLPSISALSARPSLGTTSHVLPAAHLTLISPHRPGLVQYSS